MALFVLGLSSVVCLNVAAPVEAKAFQILSTWTEPCHERMAIGSFGRGPEPFSHPATTPSGTQLFRTFVSRVAEAPVEGQAIQGMINEAERRFGLTELDRNGKFVMASLVAGVRAPDTEGFGIVDVNEVRSIHIRDRAQGAHALRRSFDDGPRSDAVVLDEVKTLLEAQGLAAKRAWHAAGPARKAVRWSFAYYGEVTVDVFAPAYELGRALHLIEDLFSHTIRDEELKILSVMNFVDVIAGGFAEERDGPPHSDRLDQCSSSDAFDRMRIEAVRALSERYIAALASHLRDTSDEEARAAIRSVVDEALVLRPGCGAASGYCGSEWYVKAREELTEPMSLGGCGHLGKLTKSDGHGEYDPTGRKLEVATSWGMGALFVLGVWGGLRFRPQKPKPRRGRRDLSRIRAIIALFLSLSALTSQARAFEDPTGGRPFFEWAIEEQLKPTLEKGLERDSQFLFALGTAATLVSQRYDSAVRERFMDHDQLSRDLTHLGSSLGSGFPGILIASTQLFFDQRAGLQHARALALTSLSHLSLMILVQRSRPNGERIVSFPSGHVASAFATATSLSYSYGWLAGVPAYSGAVLVSVSRLNDDQHWFSDIVAAAALGILWGRASAKVESEDPAEHVRFVWSPVLLADGAGVTLRWEYP